VRSAVANSLDPSKHVFHVVTDRMNLGAMQVCSKLFVGLSYMLRNYFSFSI
jgi:hypothetical protein